MQHHTLKGNLTKRTEGEGGAQTRITHHRLNNDLLTVKTVTSKDNSGGQRTKTGFVSAELTLNNIDGQPADHRSGRPSEQPSHSIESSKEEPTTSNSKKIDGPNTGYDRLNEPSQGTSMQMRSHRQTTHHSVDEEDGQHESTSSP